MRNSHNITLTNNDSLTEDEETTWSLPGAVVGFISWLFALAMPMLIYGSNTLFFFIYTWPFFLALMPVAVVAANQSIQFQFEYTELRWRSSCLANWLVHHTGTYGHIAQAID